MEANSKLKEEGTKKVMVGSLDVEALYPSIDQKEGPRIVAQEVLKSKIDIENINYHLAVVYLGTTMNRARQVREGVAHLIPPRKTRTRRGRKVTVHTKELGGPRGRKVLGEDTNPIGKNLDEVMEVDQDQEKETESKFFKFHRQYSEQEKRLIVSKVVLVATEIAFSNHIYQCQNTLYKQLRGGGIWA